MEKRVPSHPLDAIKLAFVDAARLNRTMTSRRDASAVKMDDSAVCAVIQALTSADFDKSMTASHDHRVWQDVYRPVVGGISLYVKFTTDGAGELLLISFKEA